MILNTSELLAWLHRGANLPGETREGEFAAGSCVLLERHVNSVTDATVLLCF
jgi:hypothetical protein